jgi:pseudaminic acid synthase
MKIGHREVGLEHPPLIIAEMSGNHNQSLERGLEIVEAAARAGAHALKLQTYTPDSMTLDIADGEFFISDPKNPWAGTSLYQLYEQAQTPYEWHKPLFERARKLGMLVFSTPFDEKGVEFLESLHVPCYKIASFENTDLPLIKKVAATGKPIIMSTGMATLSEIDEAVRCIRGAGGKEMVLLKCTSSYPAPPADTDLRTIPHMREMFQCEVGLSDHTMGLGVPLASVAMGASVIEKHFTLARSDGGVDSAFSMEPTEMAQLVVESERAWRGLGNVRYGPAPHEVGSLRYRRSIYVTRDLDAGEVLSRENIRIIRPGLGLPPKHFADLLGRRVARSVKRGTPMSWDLLG